MKILHVTKKYPRALGGDAIVVHNLHRQQEAAGHQVAIVTSNCQEIIQAPNIYKFGLRDSSSRLDAITPKRILSLLGLLFSMFAIIRKERPQVIHTHSVDMAFFASFAARFYKVPIVHTFHIVTFYDTNQSKLRRMTELWLAKQTRPARVTAPNNYDVSKLKHGGLEQTLLLPNGIDDIFWRAEPIPRQDQSFHFVSVGRLEQQKGLNYLICAAATLRDRGVAPFRITIVGKGSRLASLQRLVKDLGVSDFVQFVGNRTPEETRHILATADAAVFASLYETTPLTLLEAWSMGVPVISTPVGIVRDAPEDFKAVHIVPLKNESALADAMAELMTNHALRRLIADSGKQQVAQYAWPHIALQADKVYRSVVV
ncbi:MAG TPA: glycosyltransferase family 4 protein [Candidatus Saccharimonadales bacterium]|nr:glycosyltransferase family 4 protein [Candidatus Saccharimonadales bacterium]